MEFNIILLTIGLIICFGGIYFRRLFSGLLGFIWGFLGAVVFSLFIIGVYRYDLDELLLAFIIFGLITGALSVIYYKLCAAINGFISAFTIVLFLLVAINNMDVEVVIFLIALIVAIAFAAISLKFYDYSFIVQTAFIGAFIANVGGYGLLADYDLEEMARYIFWYGGDDLVPILVGTIILSIIGCFVQLKRLNILSTKRKSQCINNKGSHLINGFSETVGKNAGKIEKHVSPLLNSAFTNFGDTISDLCSEEGRAEIRDEIRNEKLLLIAPAVEFVIVPILYRMLGGSYYSSGWYSFVSWLNIVATGITLAATVYFTVFKNNSFNSLFAFSYTVSYLFFNLSNIGRFVSYYGFLYVVMYIFRYPIYWYVLRFLKKIAGNKKANPFVLTISLYLIHDFVFPWIVNSKISFNVSKIICAVIMFATAYFLFRIRSTDEK